MNKNITKSGIAILLSCIIIVFTNACTSLVKVPNPIHTDSTYNGNYFEISYKDIDSNYLTYHSQAVNYGSKFMVRMGCSVDSIDSLHSALHLNVYSPYALYGLPSVDLFLLGNVADTGVFPFSAPMSYEKKLSEVGQTNPEIVFTDTSGSAHITYNGTDYVEGTFKTTLYTSTLSYYATGSFRINK